MISLPVEAGLTPSSRKISATSTFLATFASRFHKYGFPISRNFVPVELQSMASGSRGQLEAQIPIRE